MKAHRFKILLILIILTISIPQVYAHKPIQSDGTNTTFENSLHVSDHKISWAIYEELQKYQTKFYSFEAKKDDSFYASIVIPKLERLENYKPNIAIIGEGIPIQNFHKINAELPLGGIIVYKYDGEIPSKEFYEPFGQATYWERQEIRITIPQDGLYYIVVFDNQGSEGKYSLAIGTIESFSLIDLITILPTAWLDTKIFFEDYLSVLILFAILAIPFIVLAYVKKLKKEVTIEQ